ncbi:hypothetical protein S7711_05504 [Stachybotrys chartarum IBT 7711]|uniref:DUF6314 domain-containing protein n=1 Tax=Stachybotrys chartarum (strain CBS 109288 / IBT 7711) TaxID=1280523 RepID=A0A084AS15_STACB|nr:hypothetical protein S7711_05504 [Stachybotrys chartarum IBT 7711]KFA53394.1 hypothetical protein S40293_03466 [Stachybotrys chartarum IBT 40293]KFA76095.1 hypothetical protein S40288_00346 [Stachybotrys chartarum IBT 40288]
MAKHVCIIGAGPSGLVAAKTLLHNAPKGEFKVSLYDAQQGIGGLWPLSKTDTERQVHPLMTANQSKHTMQFSDLAWEESAPQFPQAWMVGRYLQRYHDRYLAGNSNFELHLGTRVTQARPKGPEGLGWDVSVEAEHGSETRHFQHVIVSSGFFGRPIIPESLSQTSSAVPIVHSSRYRDLKSLLGTEPRAGRKILVVGGQMSGVELAGTIAAHLSSAANSPEKSEVPHVADYSVHHIIQRPTWVVPLYTSPMPADKAAPFLPLDFGSYNLNNRTSPLGDTQGHVSEEAAKVVHGIYETVLGSDQRQFSPVMQITKEGRTDRPFLAVSDWYCDFVRAGLITLSKGKLESFNDSTATLSPDGTTIDDIAAIVVATGFDPSPCLDFLPSDVREKLEHSPQHIDLPVALKFHGTHRPEIPGLGFVGFYRSPYWGVMQMQARFLARMWSDGDSGDGPLNRDPENFKRKLVEDVSIQKILGLRGNPRVTQFPMGDYLFLMQEFADALSVEIEPIAARMPILQRTKLPLDVVTPSRYIDPTDSEISQQEAHKSLESLREVAVAGMTGTRFVARAVFRSLLGTWKLERDLYSRLPSHPSGHFSGTAQFLLREKTKEGIVCASNSTDASIPDDEGMEYLYIEDGEFKTEQGFGFRATRRYVWRYDERRDVLSVWFAKPDDPSRADYLFHEVEFEEPTRNREKGWSAKAGHLCIDDFYNVKYNFAFKAVNLDDWTLRYTVNGPKKDYTISGVYKR